MFLSFEHSYFGYCFVFRASDFEFLTGILGFSVNHYLRGRYMEAKKKVEPQYLPPEVYLSLEDIVGKEHITQDRAILET